MLITALKPHPALEWYYQHSASVLGLASQSLEPSVDASRAPGPPSQEALNAARKQAVIRAALRQLSAGLQRVLEEVYEPRPHSAPLRHEHGLAAPLVAKATVEATDRASLDAAIAHAHTITIAAHDAFRAVYGAPVGKRQAREARVQRWLAEDLG